MRFRKPRKLGLLSESELRHEVRDRECTAATCLYFTGALSADLELLVDAALILSRIAAPFVVLVGT